ncbi:hypothetical protein QVD17_12699 [Tagetes erecta]|uniref:Uncharacterized protein n=1 Tax=Tagetes erecta TaxID=13708 RepID=A0AAD8KV42_TARER|nr:hypothetical protein QVD17_12699 [Tagetes erecta]
MKLEQVDPFLFIFISLDSARICRYFQFNRLIRVIAIRSRLDVPKNSISLHPIFLFRQSYEEWMRDKYSHFQSPIYFIDYCYCIEY